MLIRGLMVEGVGRFAKAMRIEGFSEGVNVLADGNEAGKSTLFRAIRACLFSRHDSKGQDIRDLAADDSQLPPVVELTFEHRGRTYIITKSFLRSPSALLTENGREIARSKQADETVWDLLGVSPGSGRAVDDGAFGVLWVGQGASFRVPAPGPAASSALNTAIESEVGSLIGGERARQTVEDINAELRRSLSETDRPKSDGPLYRATRDAEQWCAAEAEARTKLTALEQHFTELLQLRERHRDLTDLATAHQLASELVEAKESLDAARLSGQEIRRLEAEENSVRRALDAAAQRLKQYRDITARIDAGRNTEKNLTDSLPEQQAREQAARAALLHTQEQLAETETQTRALAAQEQMLGKLSNALVRATAKDDLTRRLQALERAGKDLTQIDAELSQIAVKPKNVDALDELERKIASLDAQLSAAAAQLTVEIGPTGEGLVRIGTLEPKGTHSAAILAPTRIAVGDLAVITVTPAPHARRDERRDLDDERASLLTSLGVANAAEARAMLSKRRDLEANRKGVLAELKTLGVADEPSPVVAQTKKVLAEIDATIEAALSDTQRPQLPTTTEIETARLGLEHKRVQLDAGRANLEQTRDQQQEALGDARDKRNGTESQLQLVRKTVQDDTALCPDSERAASETALIAEVAAAEPTHQNAVAILDAKRSTAADAAEIERRDVRCQRLQQALENRKNDLIALAREIGRVTGQIQTAGGDGIGETLAAAQEKCALVERELTRTEERIATLKLLRDTIAGCLTEGRERYYEPVRRHLRPYLNDLFPGSELELGDDFAITGIRRDRIEAFTRLSDGTQEQIAVLVRLAMASMLSERGQSVPVILDDALVYCDDDRIKRMFDALSRAGKRQQVIILTCRLRTFATLGGHTLRLQYPTGTIPQG
jgi:hypothetical protein